MLFDPFEEQFDLPAATLQLGDGQRLATVKLFVRKTSGRRSLEIAIANAADQTGIIVLGGKAGHHHGLVETQAGGFIHGPGVTAGAAKVFVWRE